MIPVALQAQVDQSEASLREMFGEYPTYRSDTASMNAAGLVAVDALAALSEVWSESVEARLDVLTARLLAWKRISGT